MNGTRSTTGGTIEVGIATGGVRTIVIGVTMSGAIAGTVAVRFGMAPDTFIITITSSTAIGGEPVGGILGRWFTVTIRRGGGGVRLLGHLSGISGGRRSTHNQSSTIPELP